MLDPYVLVFLHVEFQDTQTKWEDGDEFTVYNIAVEADNSRLQQSLVWSVQKRFNEFYELHQALVEQKEDDEGFIEMQKEREKFQTNNTPKKVKQEEVKWSELPPFPQKVWFGAMKEQVINQRKAMLQEYFFLLIFDMNHKHNPFVRNKVFEFLTQNRITSVEIKRYPPPQTPVWLNSESCKDYWPYIPMELATIIFTHLSIADLYSVSICSKRMKLLAENDYLWSSLYKKKQNSKPTGLPLLMQSWKDFYCVSFCKVKLYVVGYSWKLWEDDKLKMKELEAKKAKKKGDKIKERKLIRVPKEVKTTPFHINSGSIICGLRSNFVVEKRSSSLFSWQWPSVNFSTDKNTSPAAELKKTKLTSLLPSHVIVQVATGLSHSIAITQNGHVFSWGENNYGQLGYQTSSPHSPSLSSSSSSSLSSSSLSGSITNGRVSSKSVPKKIEKLTSHHILSIACGDNHSLALNNTGEIFSWGHGEFGQLGNGEFESQQVPSKVFKLTSAQKVACGANHCLVLTRSKKLYTWGLGTSGQLGQGETRSSPIPLLIGAPPLPPSSMTNSPTTGHSTTTPTNNQLNSAPPVTSATSAPNKWRMIEAGESHSIALTTYGDVYVWGSNSFGQLGLLSKEVESSNNKGKKSPSREKVAQDSPTKTRGEQQSEKPKGNREKKEKQEKVKQIKMKKRPTLLWGLGKKDILSISAGRNHCFALSDTEVYSWGNNSHGQLAHGFLSESVPEPTRVECLSGLPILQISSGETNSAFLVGDL
eukprot:TRINITY_DN2776_c0_g1_i1.p1 TRINITY_DN2776_c0_g1~~TRINITY_DN2776_c0_g1_i1.p1  ORF type:complete len:760 (+),score=193.66 TRINITY_DN2776_c0_g1_i1:75-2354(+)